MEIKDIKALAKVLEDSGLTSLEFDDGTSKIKLEKNPAAESKTVFVNGSGAVAAPVPMAASIEGSAESAPTAASPTPVVGEEVKAPMVGVYYSASSPEAAPFVSVGSRVKKGDVICIIEAMKLMNEITAERDGEIVEICADNGAIVEYGQTLFRML